MTAVAAARFAGERHKATAGAAWHDVNVAARPRRMRVEPLRSASEDGDTPWIGAQRAIARHCAAGQAKGSFAGALHVRNSAHGPVPLTDSPPSSQVQSILILTCLVPPGRSDGASSEGRSLHE